VTRSDRDKLLTLMREELYAVQASVSPFGTPQAALVGVVVSNEFEVFFDTLASSRKTNNLRQNTAAALVVGPAASTVEVMLTVQMVRRS
jgi:Pyridoxamine 5'-phosphate oxidase